MWTWKHSVFVEEAMFLEGCRKREHTKQVLFYIHIDFVFHTLATLPGRPTDSRSNMGCSSQKAHWVACASTSSVRLSPPPETTLPPGAAVSRRSEIGASIV